MSSPANELAFSLEEAKNAAQRWRARLEARLHKTESVADGQLDQADSKERLAKRANRLLTHMRERLDVAGVEMPDQVRELMDHGPVRPSEVDNAFMERVIGATRDFLSVEFLDQGLFANRCVGRIAVEMGGGRKSFGTGFFVTPRLLMTNHHVLENAQEASNSVVELDYQLDRTGQPLTVQRFALDPATFFLNDKDLDFALVAVKAVSARGKRLSDYGYCPLIGAEGKITVGEPINIIQHPRAEMKQIVIRENKLLDVLETYLHYEADTDPGSSGSPVFNDQWEVAALHHSGIPKTDSAGNMLDVDGRIWRNGDDPERLAWASNEGIRASKLVAFISQVQLPESMKRLRDEFVALSRGTGVPRAPATVETDVPTPIDATPMPRRLPNPPRKRPLELQASGETTLTVPLEITIRLGQPSGSSRVTSGPDEMALEKVEPDPDYSNRPGFDPGFLGFNVPFPKLSAAIRSQAFQLPTENGAAGTELKYYHYSVIFSKKRRLAFVAAVNLDVEAPVKFKREGNDKWFFDPRVPKELQVGDEMYAGNELDRGHLVRRDDAAWGDTEAEAKLANDDTFHFTNCSPQHEIFNQSALASHEGLKLWGNLENHVAKQAKVNNKKMCVFNGPIFRTNDRTYRGVQLPKEFFKLVVFESDAGKPQAIAFVLSQQALIKDLPPEDFEVGPYQPFQVKVSDLESRTKLDFGPLRGFDPLSSEENESFLESDTDVVAIDSLKDIVIATAGVRARSAP